MSCPLSDAFMKALWGARAVVGRLPVAPGFESGLRVKAIPGHSMEAGCTHVHPESIPTPIRGTEACLAPPEEAR